MLKCFVILFFFFQAEDGIRDTSVTGVQTCALPIFVLGPNAGTDWEKDINRPVVIKTGDRYQMWYTGQARGRSWIGYATSRSEERRVGKECRSRGSPWD